MCLLCWSDEKILMVTKKILIWMSMNGEDVTEFSHHNLVIIKQFPNSHFVSFPNITNINIMRFNNYIYRMCLLCW